MEFIFSLGGFLFLFEAFPGFTGLLRALGRQIEAIRRQPSLNPGFLHAHSNSGELMGGTAPLNRTLIGI